ncbi:MAG: HlyD family efflux transporter periplasmic adaptor subunit [Planctomycetes bacterium]|nr:HlyD family efflux transporter periplasmic adaptor subunit [Planctomycetota bacterium]
MTSHASHSNPGQTDQAWREVDELVDAVARLSTSPISPTEFHAQLMDRLVPALAAAGGAVWRSGSDGALELLYQINLPETLAAADGADRRRHAQLIAQVFQTGEARLAPPKSGPSDSQQAANPTEHVLVLCPWKCDDASGGIVEVFQRPGASPSAQQGYLRFLAAICELVADFHRNDQLRGLKERLERFAQFEQFTEQVHASLDLKTSAYTIANEGRRFIGCDRVSVAVVRGSACRLWAISGVDDLNRRANVVRQLERLSQAVATVDEPLWYSGGGGDLPPEIEEPLHAYVDESQTRTLAVIPLSAPQSEESAQERKVLGTLIVEQFHGGPDERLRRTVSAVCGHSALALAHAVEAQGGPLVRLLHTLDKTGWLVRTKHVRKVWIALAALAVAVTALATLPADFTVEAHGELQPLERRDVFAPNDGVISDLQVVRAGEVRADQVLLVMRKPELDFEFQRVWGELQTSRKKLAAVEAERLQNSRRTVDERRRHGRLTAQEEELRLSIESLEKQYAVLEEQQAALTVRSPLDGEVLTWDLKQLLEARPVSRGQVLMSVANLDGPWVLELRIPDDRVPHVLTARENARDDLEVTFILAADPGVRLTGRLDHVGIRTEVSETEDAFVLATVDVDRNEIPDLVSDSTVVAKIHCGRRSVGYVWFHELWETVQSWVLF